MKLENRPQGLGERGQGGAKQRHVAMNSVGLR